MPTASQLDSHTHKPEGVHSTSARCACDSAWCLPCKFGVNMRPCIHNGQRNLGFDHSEKGPDQWWWLYLLIQLSGHIYIHACKTPVCVCNTLQMRIHKRAELQIKCTTFSCFPETCLVSAACLVGVCWLYQSGIAPLSHANWCKGASGLLFLRCWWPSCCPGAATAVGGHAAADGCEGQTGPLLREEEEGSRSTHSHLTQTDRCTTSFITHQQAVRQLWAVLLGW